MDFTYDGYINLLKLISGSGYVIRGYDGYPGSERCAILRHDIDYEPKDALRFGEIEAGMNVSSTYFVLLSSGLYNPFAPEILKVLKTLRSMGHTVGLHFDEKAYGHAFDAVRTAEEIRREASILGDMLSCPVTAVSMHRPSRETLEADLHIPGIVNSYSKVFFNDFKYLSDSRRRWREPAEDIIRSRDYDRLHILTHPFWYRETEISLAGRLREFIDSGTGDRYELMKENITDLESALKGE